MGLAAFGILVVTGGRVALLVVLYSINVFLTFSLSLLGLCIYWWSARRNDPRWLHRIALSCLGLLVTSSILLVTLVEKFAEGGWMTVVITGVAIAFCLLNHAHYAAIRRKIRAADEALGWVERMAKTTGRPSHSGRKCTVDLTIFPASRENTGNFAYFAC
jgi:K+ transporter